MDALSHNNAESGTLCHIPTPYSKRSITSRHAPPEETLLHLGWSSVPGGVRGYLRDTWTIEGRGARAAPAAGVDPAPT